MYKRRTGQRGHRKLAWPQPDSAHQTEQGRQRERPWYLKLTHAGDVAGPPQMPESKQEAERTGPVVEAH